MPTNIIKVSSTTTPKFIKPYTIRYEHNNKLMEWEMIKTHDSVHILVDNITNKTLLFVKQLRVPVLVSDGSTDGDVVECCAGIIDNEEYVKTTGDSGAKLTAIDEVKEELGYNVPNDKISLIRKYKASVGTSGASATAFYAKVTNSMYIGQSLQEGEDIKVLEVPYNKVEEFISQETTDAPTLFLVYWWMVNKK